MRLQTLRCWHIQPPHAIMLEFLEYFRRLGERGSRAPAVLAGEKEVIVEAWFACNPGDTAHALHFLSGGEILLWVTSILLLVTVPPLRAVDGTHLKWKGKCLYVR